MDQVLESRNPESRNSWWMYFNLFHLVFEIQSNQLSVIRLFWLFPAFPFRPFHISPFFSPFVKIRERLYGEIQYNLQASTPVPDYVVYFISSYLLTLANNCATLPWWPDPGRIWWAVIRYSLSIESYLLCFQKSRGVRHQTFSLRGHNPQPGLFIFFK